MYLYLNTWFIPIVFRAYIAYWTNTAVKRLRMRELLCELIEVSARRTKTEEKYTSGRLHKALEKMVNKIERGVNTRNLSFNARKILRNSLPYISGVSYFWFLSVHTPLYTRLTAVFIGLLPYDNCN